MPVFNIEYIRCQQQTKNAFNWLVTDRQILRIIGANVRTARLRAGLTQECLAELVGVHWQTVSYLEKGRFPFSVATFTRITQVLDVSANRLLEGLSAPDKKEIERVKKVLARRRKPGKTG